MNLCGFRSGCNLVVRWRKPPAMGYYYSKKLLTGCTHRLDKHSRYVRRIFGMFFERQPRQATTHTWPSSHTYTNLSLRQVSWMFPGTFKKLSRCPETVHGVLRTSTNHARTTRLTSTLLPCCLVSRHKRTLYRQYEVY